MKRDEKITLGCMAIGAVAAWAFVDNIRECLWIGFVIGLAGAIFQAVFKPTERGKR